ncbi:hypothetical protein B0H10DRAFT_2255728 [Mycena sp. CBHHK59/15]|nr:hypothetical protein B0H10DRAFT_2255728 [Mycena sp. CBHHK59/15]
MSTRKGTMFDAGNVIRDYKYTQEISQMVDSHHPMFVFGEVQDPNSEMVNLVEDIVCGQIIELASLGVLARHQLIYIRRSSRLIRHDRGKDVRKHAKDSGGDGGGGMEVETLEDRGDDKLTTKAQKITIKLPWEITMIYSEVLKQSGHQSDDEEDEDDIEAHEASILHLKEANNVTLQMTCEEYQHYTECRQASFTWRKAKRFREFLNLPTHLDFKAGDDAVNIVGFLAFEMKSLEESHLHEEYTSPSMGKHKGLGSGSSAEKRQREDDNDDAAETVLPINTLFLLPPEAHTRLRPEHIQDVFARMPAKSVHLRSMGTRNWCGGLARTRITLI